MIRRIGVTAIAFALVVASAEATTFVVLSDRVMIATTPSIVVGTAVISYTQLNDRGGIETITSLAVESVLKGSIAADTITIREPGGRYGDRFQEIAAVPRFRDGERVLLFLRELPGNQYVVHNLALGKFSLARDDAGRNVAIRQEEEINGWTKNGGPQHERRRDAEKFVSFIRAIDAGANADDDAHFLRAHDENDLQTTEAALTLSAGSYLLDGKLRWSTFPQTFTHTNTLAGASHGGTDAIVAALAMWSDDPRSTVELRHAGLDASKTGGTLVPDGRNSIAWEQDLTSYGIAPYVCGVGGVMGIGSIAGSTALHKGPGGASFATATEGDVDMNVGLADCTSLFESPAVITSLAHEIGHTLGLRHSDQYGGSDAAVMRSSIEGLKATLQTWDRNAVRVIYPLDGPPVAPTNVIVYSSTAHSISLSWSAPDTATSYRVYRRTAPGAYLFIANVPVGTSYVDEHSNAVAAYEYVVTALNASGESINSNAVHSTSVEFTDFFMVPGVTVKLVHFEEMRTAVNALRALAGLSAFSFAAPTPGVGVKITKAHMTGLRIALNEARQALLGSPIVFAESDLTGKTIKASHVSEIRGGVF
jgi:hypothetical protein